MSISQSLNNASSGLTANSRMAEVVSSNLSNAMTDGYGRRTVELSSQAIGGRSAGVQVQGILRHVNHGVIGERRLADAAVQAASRQTEAMARVETAFGPPDDPTSLASRLVGLEIALENASADPASDQRLAAVVTRLHDVTRTLSQAAQTVQSLRQQADADIARDVQTLNTALAQVQKLNVDIVRTGAQGHDPSGLMDQRTKIIDIIGQIVPVREIQQAQGRVALWTTSGTQLLDSKPAILGFGPTPTIVADMTFTGGALQGVTINGHTAGPDGFGKLAGGSLGANFNLRDDALVAAQTGLDQMAVELIMRFQDPSVDPTLANDTPGLLTNRGMPYRPDDFTGLSQRITINAAVDPARGGALFRLRDGVAATGPGAVGQSAQLIRFTDALSRQQTADMTIPEASAISHVARQASIFSTNRLNSEESYIHATARRDSLKEAELAGGVDSDAELQTLIRIEQAFAANAKVMATIQSLIQSLMEI